jgi:hypothetical protein
MSEGDLERLAELIADKLIGKQKEMDEEYMRMLYEAQQNKDVGDYEVEFFSFKDMSEQPKTKEDKLNELKEGLQDAIDKEDYTRAADIQKNISELESEGNQED